jgi:putative ABC transport system permease protein
VWDASTIIRRFFLRLLTFLRVNHAETELAREISSHLQLLEDEFVAKGMPRADARLAARRAFGGVEQAKEHQRDVRGFRWLEDSRIDFKLGARMLTKYPGLSLIGGAGLAVGVGIGTAFFAFFYAYAYSTIPGPDGHRIVGLENWSIKTNNEVQQAAHDFVQWRDELTTVQELGAFRTVGRNLVAPDAAVEPIRVAEIPAVGLQVPRVQPRLGRGLLAADELPGARPVLVIGSDVWESRFNSDPAVIGREVRLGNVVHIIVGVMPEGFEFPVNHSYWAPLHLDPLQHPRRQGPAIFIFGRLAPGATMEQAQAELTTIASRASAQFPDTHADLRARVMPYAHPIIDIQGFSSWEFAMMQSLVSLLLLVVALNVAILIYARTATRQGEIAVRTALGATRGRLVGQLFIEALILCMVASGAGVLLAHIGIRMGHGIMETEVGRLPYFIDDGIPAPAYAYVALLTLVAAVIAGVLPALQATGRRMESTLKEFGGRSGLRLGGMWTTMIVAQVALAVAGLSIALGGFWSTIVEANTRMAFETRTYLAASIAVDSEQVPALAEPIGQPAAGVDPETARRDAATRAAKLRSDLMQRLAAEPQVEDVALARAIPGNEPSAQIEIEGAEPPSANPQSVQFNEVSDDFFAAFEVPLIAGRLLTAADTINVARPIVVNQTFAQRVLGNRDAIGARVRYLKSFQDGLALGDQPEGSAAAAATTEPWHEVVGVVGDMSTNAIDPELVRPAMFHALGTSADLRPSLLLKVRGQDAAAFSAPLREITMSLDPSARLNVRPFVEMERQQELALRLIVVALSLIFVAVLSLSAAGIYALMSLTVSRRTKEIGIRAAMGADASQLLRGIFARSAWQLCIGVAVGGVLAFVTDRLAGGDALGPTGRTVFVPLMAVVMVAVGLIASLGPARRGLKVQPTEALRAE